MVDGVCVGDGGHKLGGEEVQWGALESERKKRRELWKLMYNQIPSTCTNNRESERYWHIKINCTKSQQHMRPTNLVMSISS